MDIRERIEQVLQARKEKGEFRSLSGPRGAIDLTSNDYLGLARSGLISRQVQDALRGRSIRSGSTGSRLLSGNSSHTVALEAKLAEFHGSEAALIMNSGYTANTGLIGTICRPGDVILFDAHVHASILQGIALGKADSEAFEHNSLQALKKLLKKHSGKPVFIVVESVYSMDGDQAPLVEICALKKEYDFELIVDEAHALGVFGKQGRGLCDALGVSGECFARIYTFGKALGSHGAVITCQESLKQYLVNFCKPFIYSTALDEHTIACVEHSYKFILNDGNQIDRLLKLINYFNVVTRTVPHCEIIGKGPVFGLVLEGVEQTRTVAGQLNSAGFDVRPIVYPTVARGRERIRISLHSFNTKEEIDGLIGELKKHLK